MISQAIVKAVTHRGFAPSFFRTGLFALAIQAIPASAATFSFAGFSWDQDKTPNILGLIGDGANLGGAQFSAGLPTTTSTASPSRTRFPTPLPSSRLQLTSHPATTDRWCDTGFPSLGPADAASPTVREMSFSSTNREATPPRRKVRWSGFT